jgi:Acyl-CoA dehydrogenase, C-terminal domain
MGLRGMDLSGLAFDAARVPATAVIGEPGHGLEILLRAQQLARLAICGLSLGGADNALRSVARFATDRVLYGAPITTLPYVRDRLVGALLDIYIGEAVLIGGFRGVHAAADQLALWTAIAKAVVPTRLDQAVIELRLVLGARYHLRTGHADGMFQKVLRDHLVLAVVEGSTAVNLKSIATQLRGLARRALRPQDAGEPAARAERLAIVFGLDRPLPPVSLHALTIAAGRDDITAGVADAAREASAPGELGARIHALIATLAAELDAVYRAVAALPTRYGQAQRSTAELTALAERYATLHAGACCVHLWRFTLACDDPTWLALCLSRLLAPSAPVPAAWTEHALARLAAQLDGNQLFSLCTLSLAGDATLEETP